MRQPIHFKLMRGGSSKGVFLYGEELSSDTDTRNKQLIEIMGSNTLLQTGGLGGGFATTNKVCLVYPSERKDIDLEYLICQVSHNKPDKPEVDDSIDCGNMLAAVGPFAIEEKLVKANDPQTLVRIYSRNTKTIIEALINTPGGAINYNADATLTIFNPGGTTTGKLFPTGNLIDRIDGVEVTCIDASMPLIIVAAESLGKTGNESKAELDNDKSFMQKMDELRKAGIKLMNLPSDENKAVAKICMVSQPTDEGHIKARYLISPGNCDCHPTFAVTGAISLSAAASIGGTVANRYVSFPHDRQIEAVKIEHPKGIIEAAIHFHGTDKACIHSASYNRPAQLIASGKTFLNNTPSPEGWYKLNNVSHLFKKRSENRPTTPLADPKAQMIAAYDAGHYDEAIAILRALKVRGLESKR